MQMDMELFGLCEKIRAIAKIGGGYASVTHRDGICIKTYNHLGSTVKEMEGRLFELAKLAGESGELQVGPATVHPYAEAWAFPVGRFVVTATNALRAERDHKLREALLSALPYIAQAAGGEAVIFDGEGRRKVTYDAGGNFVERMENTTSAAAAKAMATQKPIIGSSVSDPDALAVRIPITDEFGFGFNNVTRVQQQKKLVEEVRRRRVAKYDLEDIIGISEPMQQLKEMVVTVAKSDSSVLLYGETGTGKELLAQAIHNNSDRSDKPFIAINCAAIPSSIAESYLFGYAGGAFSGAKREGSVGAFEEASGGTIFLDELHEMAPELQSKLLRVLQERELMRVGAFKPIKVNVRVISATNQNLKKLVSQQKLRSDLYYRLNILELSIPPLRERKKDIRPLVNHFIKQMNVKNGKYVFMVDEPAMEALEAYSWPGNIRELQNCIERAINVVGQNDNMIEVRHLPAYVYAGAETDGPGLQDVPLKAFLEQQEKKYIQEMLNKTNHSKKETARLLEISLVTLWRKIKDYNL